MDYDTYRSKGKTAGGIKAKDEMEVKIKGFPGLTLFRQDILHLRNQNQLTHETQDSVRDISHDWKWTSDTGGGKALILQELHCG